MNGEENPDTSNPGIKFQYKRTIVVIIFFAVVNGLQSEEIPLFLQCHVGLLHRVEQGTLLLGCFIFIVVWKLKNQNENPNKKTLFSFISE